VLEPVLVLNANFEPINICSTRRAMGLLLTGKAGMVVNGRGYIRTIKELLPRPSVIRLESQVHRPLPRHLGGQHIWTNVVAACPSCNHRKGGRKLEESRMVLLHKPKEPPANASYIFGRHLTDNGEWEPYISGW
jgi:hypothetical protein